MGGGDEGDLQAEALLLAPLPCPWEKEVQVSVLRVGKSGVRLCHLLAPVTLGKLLNPQNLSSYLALEVERTPLRLPHRQGALQLVWGEEDLGLGLRLFWILGAGTFQAFSLGPPAAWEGPGLQGGAGPAGRGSARTCRGHTWSTRWPQQGSARPRVGGAVDTSV